MAALAVLLAAVPACARADDARPVTLGTAARFDVSPPLRSLRPLAPGNGHAFPARRRGNTLEDIAVTPHDRARQPLAGAAAGLVAGGGWDGVSNIDSVVPPDTNGDVGPNDYVQWVNLSFQIWNKSGTSRYGPAAGNTLWQGFGGPCEQFNQGDPVVLYDRMADRWIFGQFGFATKGGSPKAPYYECVAVSTSGDPTGTYYRYAFNLNPVSNDFPDYPKLGIWPDGYYLSTNNFNGNSFAGAGAYVLDRTKMLAGDASAGFVGFQLGSQYEGLLPANLTGPTLPPAGSPDYFGSIDTSSSGGTGSAFQIWKLHADWTTPASSTLTGPASVPVSPYTFAFCNQAYSSACIAQPGTSQTLDPLADRLMNRLEYRNFGDHESLVADHTVNVGSNRAGVRWYEIRSPGGSPVVAQQGTYAPSDGVSRWMGSVAMDGAGDIAIGYSASGSSTYPGIRYTAHAASDPAGVAGQAEQTLVAGAGAQTGYPRWGDYSAMAVDPSDDATFWYTQEYYSATSSFGWRTRIGSFTLGVPPPAVSLTSPAAGSTTNDATPLFAGTAGTAAGDASTVTVDVHSGTTTGGALVQSDSAMVMPGGGWSIAASPALADGTYTAQASQTGSGGTGRSAAVTFTVDTTPPAAPVLSSPADGSITNSSTVTVAGSAEAGSTVTIYDGATSKGSVVASGAGAWSKTLSAVADGTHTYTATATDAAGNTSAASASRTVTVDTIPPAAPVLSSPANGSLTNDNTVTVAGTAEAGSTVTVYDGATSKGTTAVDGSGAWTKTLTAVADGTHTYTAKATDAAGNTSPSSSSHTVTIDTTPPAAPVLSSPADGSLTASNSVTVAGTAEAGSTVTVYDAASSDGTALASGAGAWSKTLSGVADGSHTYTATATDAAGNTSAASASRTVTVDTTPPAIAITAPADGSTIASATPVVSGTSSDPGTVTLTVDAGGSAVQTQTPVAGADGTWSAQLSPALADGAYTLTAGERDAAGNVGTSATVHVTVAATIANEPPLASFTFAPAAPFAGAPVAFDGSGSSDPDGTVVAWAWSFGDGATGGGAGALHAYALPGSYPVQLTVTDDRGATGATARTVTVAPAPAPTTVPPPGSGPGAGPGTPPPAATTGTAPSKLALTASIRIPRQHLATVLRRGLRLLVRSNARGRVILTLLRGSRRAGRATVGLDGIHWVALRVRLSRSALRSLRGARRTRITLTADVRGLAGARVPLRQTVTLRR